MLLLRFKIIPDSICVFMLKLYKTQSHAFISYALNATIYVI